MKDTKAILKEVWKIIDEKQGQDVLILDVREISSFTSFFVLCEGRNPKQSQAISDAISLTLKQEHRLVPEHVEGYREAHWILLDYADFIVHIFGPETRSFYSLEKLWGDGIRLEGQALSA